ncbi:MAG: NAD(P)/FAD-dependent oxidoreductase [Gemmatimonadota bacterium]
MYNAPFSQEYDVLVAGARCAGASTAMLLARAGMKVLVVDPLPPGRDALSTHALMRGAVGQLHRWRLLDAVRKAGTPAVRTTTFDYGDDVVSIPIRSQDGVDALYAPRRTVLDPLLEEAAVRAGATVRRGWSVTGLLHDTGGRVNGATISNRDSGTRQIRARWVVGADGARSRVARLVGAPVTRRARHSTATLYGYWPGLGEDDFRWIFRPGRGLGLIPTNEGEICVFISMPPERFASIRPGTPLDRLLEVVREAVPELADRLAGTPPRGSIRGFAGLRGFLRQPVGPGWALVGDSGYFRDPLTAHGITDALRDAELLSRALIQGGTEALDDYRYLRDAAADRLFTVTDAIASLGWSMDEVRELHHALARAMKDGVLTLGERSAA